MENEKQQDGVEERANPFDGRSEIEQAQDANQQWLEAETATLSDERDRLKEALLELCEVLKSQPTYESFHEYELSGTPDLCRRCGKYIDHAYHGTALERAKALIDDD